MTRCPNNHHHHHRSSYSYFIFICFVYIVTIRFGFASTSLDLNKEEVNPRIYNDSEQFEISTTVSPSLKHLAQCGNTQRMVDNCFRDLPPHLMTFLQSKKVAINKNEVLSKCNDQSDKEWGSVGIKDGYRDYLKHKDCLSYIQDDWMRCTKSFQIILTEELYMENKNVTQKFMEFCCARHAYETCIYNSARYKCYKHSAKFAREAAKMLTDEKHFSNCRQYEAIMCNGTASLHRQYQQHCWHCWLLLLLLILCRLFLPTHRHITH
uniref:Uncharacterized protein n=1 Tax=Glossina morsitans morsitans TaxID=37546 RepID=A0A1B0FIE2_GLOMM